MRIVKDNSDMPSMDAVAEEDDVVDIRIQDSATGQVVYVDVNGITILRIGHLKQEIEVTRT